jgi:PAS domain S-box-containing protein
MRLADQVRTMGQGDHVCLVYDTFEAQVQALVPFLREGLERGEHCLYFCDEDSADGVAGALREAGLNVGEERDAVQLLTQREVYLADGEFSPEGMIHLLGEMETRALAKGYTGLRITGEPTWALGTGADCARLVEYEALLNRHFPGSRALAVCQYDRERFAPEVLEQILQTHPLAMVGDQVIANRFFEPPEIFFGHNGAEARLAWKLEQLQQAGAAEERGGGSLGFATVIRDVGERRRAEALLAAQKHSLELVVTGAPLAEVLRHLVTTVEEQSVGGVVGSILLLDGDGRLRDGASPSLPRDYVQAMDGIRADPEVGTCAAAAARGEVVITPDFAADPAWSELCHLPLALGLVGAWSMPITARDGRVLGTFGTYFRERRRPTAVEQEVVEVLARTAAITIERDRAEAALREREAFNRRLLESSGDCIKVLDLAGRLLSINEGARRLMQVDDLGAYLGRNFLDFWSGGERDAAERALAEARSGGEGRFEGFCPTARGEPRWWDQVVTAIPDAEGRPFRLLVVSRDVSARKAAAEELRMARDAAEAASRAKSQFLAVMSHELRTPLTGIIGFADLLGSDIWGPTSDKQRAQIARIKSGAWHLVSIIEEILTFSRMEAGKEGVSLQRVNLVCCVRESVELLHPQAAEKGIELRVVGDEMDAEIETDVGKLRQMVLNLAGNAVKFTERGVVEISIECASPDMVVRVRDTGPGIPPDKVERIFEPFVQVDQTNTRTKGGTGLGLTVCRSLAQLLGGDVILEESTPGEGSTFALRLPRVRSGGAEAGVGSAAAEESATLVS